MVMDLWRRRFLAQATGAASALALPAWGQADRPLWVAQALSQEFGFPVHFDLHEPEAHELLRGMIVKRGNALDPTDPRILMDTVRGLAYFAFTREPTAQVRLDLAHPQLLPTVADSDTASALRDVKTPSAVFTADWVTAEEVRKRGMQPPGGSNANIFGGVGMLRLPAVLRIAVVQATPANVARYGMTLYSQGDVFTFGAQMDALLMVYRYDEDYRGDFVLQPNGGGGFFVETHAFPHIHAPMNRQCGGFITIGRRLRADRFEFTAFRIPYGHALYIPPHTIHGDSTLLGDYAITVSHTHADTVVLRQEGRIAQKIFAEG